MPLHERYAAASARVRAAALLLVFAAVATGCSTAAGADADGKISIVASVSPITDIVRNVAGTEGDVVGLIPEGVDSHTFEPTPDTARALADADVIFLNGLDLEDPTLKLAQADRRDGAMIYLLGPHAVDPAGYLYDFSFPRSLGHPNPHLWMDVANAITYTQLVRDALVRVDPANAPAYRANAVSYVRVLRRLDGAVQRSIDTIPPANRVLLTYHDSFAYFAAHYGMRVIGAIQPSDFAEPSAQEVAALEDQIRATGVPAIFGSEVFPSPVLAQIAQDTGVRYEASLRDDDLPGASGTPQHSYVGLIEFDVRTMVIDLGGDPSALASVRFTNRYD
jgi:ABC-type Zn uptake system ZnuABC Zn-binding protein ZnuA